MAGSAMTFVYDDAAGLTGNVSRIICDWVSDDGGGVAGTCIFDTKKISGYLLKGVTNPDGVAAPTNLYDIELLDLEGANILANCNNDLADRLTATIESTDFVIDGTGSAGRPCVCEPITVSIAAAGNSKEGRIVLYWVGA